MGEEIRILEPVAAVIDEGKKNPENGNP